MLVKKLRCTVFLRGCVTDRTTAARISNSFDFLRLLVVYDRQSNGTLPAISDILAMRDLAGAVTTTLQDHQEMMIMLTDSKFFGSWLGYE